MALVVLARHPVRRGETWARVLTPAVGLLLWLPTLWATVEVTVRTEAVAPWYGSTLVVALLLVGAIASATDRRPRSTGP